MFKVTPFKGETRMEALLLSHTSRFPSYIHNHLSAFQNDIYSMLVEYREWYPGILAWYFQKFFPGLSSGSRSILLCLIDNRVAGIALLKNDFCEKKICTFRVREQYRKNGIGKTLFEKCMEVLDTDKPMITTPSERLCYFSSVFKYYSLKLEQVAQNYYRNNSSEYVFNGYLDSKTTSSYGNDRDYEEEGDKLLTSSFTIFHRLHPILT